MAEPTDGIDLMRRRMERAQRVPPTARRPATPPVDTETAVGERTPAVQAELAPPPPAPVRTPARRAAGSARVQAASAKWRPIGWAEETGQIKSGVGPFLQKRMMERQAFVAREAFPTRGDKAIRAQSIRGRMAMNGLYMLADAPWRADLHAEMMSFPVGVHDDQVDALGLVGQLLDRMQSGKPLSPQAPKPTQPPGTVFLPGAPEPEDRTRRNWG